MAFAEFERLASPAAWSLRQRPGPAHGNPSRHPAEGIHTIDKYPVLPWGKTKRKNYAMLRNPSPVLPDGPDLPNESVESPLGS